MPDVMACSFESCDKGVKPKGYLCSGHYEQRRLGKELKPLRIKTASGSAVDVFWSCVAVGEPDQCWPWLRTVNGNGYGRFRRTPAHRVAYELAVGAIPDGKQIDHQCRNRLCVNPHHLLPVSNKHNHENLGISRANTSGARGVSRDKATGRWSVSVVHNGKKIWGGRYDHLTDAENAAIRLRNLVFTNNVGDRTGRDA